MQGEDLEDLGYLYNAKGTKTSSAPLVTLRRDPLANLHTIYLLFVEAARLATVVYLP